VTGLRFVNIYLALAASFPPWFLVPNWPIGKSRFTLLLPTKFYAMVTTVD